MALINCTECGKEISDKAVSCPHCGNPINQQTEEDKGKEYMRCPKCHSKELHSQQAGFSGGKALVGAALVGGVGLLAGTIGSQDVQLTCLRCNKTFKVRKALIISDEKEAEVNKELERIIVNDGKQAAFKYYCRATVGDYEDQTDYVCQFIQKNKIVPLNTGCAGVILLFILLGSALYMVC